MTSHHEDGAEVVIDEERCQGHGRCALLCPSVFEFSEAGQGVVVQPEVPEALVPDVNQAIATCPERAISWNTKSISEPQTHMP